MQGLYPASAPDDEFSFADTFAPLNFEGARFCEARVWSFFRKMADGALGSPSTGTLQNAARAQT